MRPAPELEVRLLGPFQALAGSRPVPVPAGRQRTLLAVLAMSAGRGVSTDRLVTAVWGERLPADGRRSIQTYLARLRAILGTGTITKEPTGYALRADPDQVDALRLIQLLDAARADPVRERECLLEALSLWRGTPFDGLRCDWLDQTETPRLVERYLTAIERRIDLDLAGGRHAELPAQLRELTAQHPLRESLWVRLLVVLDRCGRQAEALEQYETIRTHLADTLGADPGPELRRLHVDLLTGRAATPARPAAPPAAPAVVPRQLPADLDAFAGREAALKALHDLLPDGAGRLGGPVVISAIGGTAGIGKTTLAVHWAHQVADRFPDGQLYVNLRGFHPSGSAVTPAEAVRGFLDGLGVPPHRIPPDLDAQTARYRSLLAGRRMLVLLDNAHDADQVRPLLPGSPTCLVLVTSRDQLTGLIATGAARPVLLDLLPIEQARDLLANRLGGDRLAAEPEATDEIITRCARLPLTLALAAARATTRPTLALGTLAAQLRDASALDVLTAGDPGTDPRAVFSWSYQALGADAARLFRMLGLHPGPDISTPAVASLAGQPEPQVTRLLGELCRAHLLAAPAPHRYAFHDLLRAYAGELAHAHDAEPERHAALGRLLDHYLHTAHAAALLLHPRRESVRLPPRRAAVKREEFRDRREALDWFAAERTGLVAAVGLAAGAGFDTHASQLAWSLSDFLEEQGHWADWEATQRGALAAGIHLDSRSAQALAHRALGRVFIRRGRFDDAYTHLGRALDLYGELGDLAGQARTCRTIAYAHDLQGRYAEALPYQQQAHDLFRAAGDRVGQAFSLNGLGWCHAHLGDHRRSLTLCERALAIQQEIGDPHGQADTWDSIGYAHHHLGNFPQAIDGYQRALDLFRDLGNRYLEAETLTRLGDTHAATGDAGAARTAWWGALPILDGLDHPDADRVRARLRDLGQER
jgi:DNA-binding SARP family transcriptional activator/tetratricopeptide (TPR) repeat protein